MSEINHNPNLETDLAQAAKPENFDGEKIEATHDPTQSLNRGLTTLYKKHLYLIDRQREEGLIDSGKADELADSVLTLIEKDGLENEIGYTSREKAQEIMGSESYFGPNEVRKAGIEIREEIPPVPFNPKELERGKELGQMLIYRTSTTMKELNDTISPKLKADGKGDLLNNIDWCREEVFYRSEKIQPGWALVSKELTPGSIGKNYLEQSELITEYLVNEVFKGKPLPLKYQVAIDQLNVHKETIRQLIDLEGYGVDDDHDVGYEEVSQMLSDLQINQLFRQTPAEVVYDFIVYLQNTRKRLHVGDYVWTNAHFFSASLIRVGRFDYGAAGVSGLWPGFFESNTGTSFCRRR